MIFYQGDIIFSKYFLGLCFITEVVVRRESAQPNYLLTNAHGPGFLFCLDAVNVQLVTDIFRTDI